MELDNTNFNAEVTKSKRSHINIDESDIEKYKLVEKKLPFKNHLHTFTVATFLGYYYVEDSMKIKKKYNGFVHLDVFRNSQYLDFLKTFAIVHEKDPLILVDEKRIFSICEEYARTGIELMVSWVDSMDEDIENKIAKILVDKFDELNVE